MKQCDHCGRNKESREVNFKIRGHKVVKNLCFDCATMLHIGWTIPYEFIEKEAEIWDPELRGTSGTWFSRFIRFLAHFKSKLLRK